QQIAEAARVRGETQALAQELGITDGSLCRRTGILYGVIFPGDVHPDFLKPKARSRNRTSYPKKGSDWAKRLAAQRGTPDASILISTEFEIPLSISYTTDSGSGWSHIGSMLTECGFLWLGEDGPYAMWAPDVPALVAEGQARGQIIAEPAASFSFNIEGARRIEKEEWEILVLQHELAEKKRAAAQKGGA
ncbi:MAG: hypothetical protein RSC66_04850, partial [Comamonas sp.]